MGDLEFGRILILAVLTVALSISAVTDLRTRKILNKVTYPCLLLGLALHLGFWRWDTAQGMGLKWSIIGLLAGGVPFLVLNAMNPKAMGMGDVKLMAAVGALSAYPLIIDIWFHVAIAGGILAVVVLLWKGQLGRTLGKMAKDAASKMARKGPGEEGSERADGAGAKEPGTGPPDADANQLYLPYGVAISAGTFWALAVEYLRTGSGS